LDKKLQSKFIDAGNDIARLRDDYANMQRGYVDRFNAIAARDARGGEYRGAFRDRQTAAEFGRMVAFAATKDVSFLSEQQRATLNTAGQSNGFEPNRASLGITSGQAGGYLMPDLLVQGIIRNVETYGAFEKNANTQPVPSQTGKRAK